MATESKTARNIKTGGSVALYVGTASIIRPIISKHVQGKSGFTKLCSIFTGTVVSCGISAAASEWFSKIVDKVYDFIDDVKAPPKRIYPKEDTTDAK